MVTHGGFCVVCAPGSAVRPESLGAAPSDTALALAGQAAQLPRGSSRAIPSSIPPVAATPRCPSVGLAPPTRAAVLASPQEGSSAQVGCPWCVTAAGASSPPAARVCALVLRGGGL